MPAAARRTRAARRHARRRPRDVGVRGRLLPAGRAERGRGPAQGRVEHGAGALRRDAARLLRHRGPRRRHGPRRRVRDAVLPVADRRLRGHDLRQEQGPGARPRVHCGRGTTGTSRSGPARTPTASSRCSSRGCSDPEIAAADIRRNAERGFKAVSFPENPVDLKLPVDAHRSLGSVPARVRGDRDRRLPAQRVVVVDRGALAGRAARALHEPVPGERAGHRGRLAVGARSRRASRTSRSRSPRAASAGCRC